MNNFEPSLGGIVENIMNGERRSKFCRIIAIDGPAGAGKSTLASRISAHFPEPPITVIHMDEIGRAHV